MRRIDIIKPAVLAAALFLFLACCVSFAVAADATRGEVIYKKRCALCHGADGLGDGAAANVLLPGPRDFSDSTFKFRSSAFDELTPTDDDLFNIIKGSEARTSAMPGFGDVLSDAEIRDVVAHLKTLAGMEGVEAPKKIDLSGRVKQSEESIREGKRLFEEKGRCTDCHGMAGRGDAIKSLKDDWGKRTWPRNLTKGWTFMVSNDPADIYTRITTGIPGTQMPSFADPASKLVLTEAERWHVANYVASLDEKYKHPIEGSTIHASRVDNALPIKVTDPAWEKAVFATVRLLPQLMTDKRLFAPTVDAVSIKALHNDDEVAFLIEWDDRTESVPGDEAAEKLATGAVRPDAVALEFALNADSASAARPHFAEGGPQSAVDIWFWKGRPSPGDAPRVVQYLAKGFKEKRLKEASEIVADSAYSKGTWRVVMKRSLKTRRPGEDAQFSKDALVPLAIAVWDGSNDEEGSRHSLTTWQSLSFEAGRSGASHMRFLWPIITALLVLAGEIAFILNAKAEKP